MLSIIRDQHESSHHTEAEFSYNSLLYIQNICNFLTSLPPLRHSSKTWPISW